MLSTIRPRAALGRRTTISHSRDTLPTHAARRRVASGLLPLAAIIVVSVPLPLTGQLNDVEAQAALEAHNRWRARHQSPPLTWSVELAAYAQSWAEYLASTHAGLLLHSEDAGGVRPEATARGYAGWGENLSWFSPLQWADGRTEVRDAVTPGSVVDAWVSEVRWYDFDTTGCAPDADPGCGHFTQVVWSGTLRVGCGRAVGADKSQVWACSYDPPRNWDGEYRANVKPPAPGESPGRR